MSKRVLLYLLCLCVGTSITCEAKNTNFHVITVATEENVGLNQLRHCCREFGIDLRVLGMGIPYPGHGYKLSQLQNFVRHVAKDDVVLFVDAYDVLILADKKTILEKFRAKNVPFIISTESNCWPLTSREAEFPPSPTPFRFINSGGIIGYAGHIRKILSALKPIHPKDDDQGRFTELFLKDKSLFCLDYQADIFLTLHGVSKNDLVVEKGKKRVKCLITESIPLIIHGNGYGKLLYYELYNFLFGKSTKL